MKHRLVIPPIPEAERTPLVVALLGIIEALGETVQKHEEQIELLKDEIRILKGGKKRPQFKPCKMYQGTARSDSKEADGEQDTRRAGSDKRNKTAELEIHDEQILQPKRRIPPGSRFKGYRNVVIQDLVIRAHNIRYRLARWLTPQGEYLIGELPAHLAGGHFGTTLRSYELYQHHHCQVTQPLLHEQLREWGIDISRGTIDALLSAGQDAFHGEKDEVLSAGLASAAYVSAAALDYMRGQGLPQAPVRALSMSIWQRIGEAHAWEAHLDTLGVRDERHRRIATEGALLGELNQHSFSQQAIISDDAGQFDVLRHSLCWKHTKQKKHTKQPQKKDQQEDIA